MLAHRLRLNICDKLIYPNYPWVGGGASAFSNPKLLFIKNTVHNTTQRYKLFNLYK